MSPKAARVADPVAVVADGRRQRGDASRRAILDAASRVIVDDGVAAITHRSVAVGAGVSLARVSYHFPKVDDLLAAATTHYLEAFDERLLASAASAVDGRRTMVDACTDFLFDLVTAGAAEFLSMVEVRLALHRRGGPLDQVGVVGVISSFGIDDERAQAIVAALFGFAVLAATAPEAVGRDQVRYYVSSILEGAP